MRSILSLMVLTFILVILSHKEVRILQAQNETSALLEWRESLDRQSQLILISWSKNDPCQSWIGIICSNNEHVVTEINVPSLSLKGSIASLNFSSFRNLEHLDLHNNSLFGSIPSNLANASQLRFIDLSFNNFSGVIPSEIGTLSMLDWISLNSNKLNGHIPNSVGKLTNLTHLYLYSNKLTGDIPNSIGKLTNLTYLYLYSNKLTGHIPNSVGNLINLVHLYLNDNELIGPIPQEIGMLSEKLQNLDLSSNNLTGEIPSSLGNLTYMYFFYLYDNHLSGTIPPELVGARDLMDLQICFNHLTGPIPDSFRNFTRLDRVCLSSNNLNGSFPKDINLSKIRNFLVFNNMFSGPLPYVGESLEFFLVDNNMFSGPLPRVGKLVQKFTASNNLFSGEIPLEIGNSSSLAELDLSRNQLSGPIPATILNLTSLQFLKLDDNMLHGSLPGLPTNIILYSVKNNIMAGELPSGICSSRFLEVLHLSNNYNIGGALPDCFRNSSRLTSLSLSGNRLQGLVPRSLANCRLLEVLDLGNNMITDTFPHWLDALPELQVLVARSNKLHGSIEKSSSKLLFPKLRILDLSGNFFTGRLPSKYFENFKAMMDIDEQERGLTYIGRYEDSVVLVVKGLALEYKRILNVLTTIDLSDNKFDGEIPSNIKMLNSLRFLNLSHNHLSGQIPAMLDNLTNLESLDLSSNQVQGNIPVQLTRLTFLAFFNVSGNQLNGTIPKGGQFNTFGNNSYQGNPGLCGFPLPNCVHDEEPSHLRQEEEDDTSGFFYGFTWESVVLGFGCGIVIGVGLGYLMFSTGKPIWVTKIVNTQKRRGSRSAYVRRETRSASTTFMESWSLNG